MNTISHEAAAGPAVTRTGRYWSASLTILAVLAACWLVRERLTFWLWHDEIYALRHFATGCLEDALLDYHLPNNHILFSAVFGQLRSLFGLDMSDMLPMRLLMLAFFAAAIVLLFRASRREEGAAGAGLATILLVTSHPILAYAVQIRGYGPSLILTAWALIRLYSLRAEEPGWRAF